MKVFILFISCILLMTGISASNPKDSLQVKIIHGKKYIMHQVGKSEGAIAIARRYNITVAQLSGANNVDLNKLKKGQLLKIPILETTTDTISSTRGRTDIDATHANADEFKVPVISKHTVQSGETLTKIANRYKVSVQDIQKWNGLKEAKIQVGQELTVNPIESVIPFIAWNKPVEKTKQTVALESDNIIEQYGQIKTIQGHAVSIKNKVDGKYIWVYFTESNVQHILELTESNEPVDENEILLGSTTLSVLGISNTQQRVIIKYIAHD